MSQDHFCANTRKVRFETVFTLSREKYHATKAPTTATPYIMADSVGDNRLHLIITMGRRNLVVGELADSVGGNRPRLMITTKRPIRTVTHTQSVRRRIGFSAWHGEIISSR